MTFLAHLRALRANDAAMATVAGGLYGAFLSAVVWMDVLPWARAVLEASS